MVGLENKNAYLCVSNECHFVLPILTPAFRLGLDEESKV